MTTFLFLALLASSPVKFQGVSALVLPIPAILSNGLSLPFLGIQDHRIFYVTDHDVHVIADYPDSRLKLIKKFPVLTQTEQEDQSHRAAGVLVEQNRVYVLLWFAGAFEDWEGFEAKHYLRAYDFEGNLIYSKEFLVKSEVEKGIHKGFLSPRSFHFNESGQVEVDYAITGLNKAPALEDLDTVETFDLETWCFEKKDGRLLSHLKRRTPYLPSLLGGNGLICQTWENTMSIGSCLDISVCQKPTTSSSLSLKVLIEQGVDETFPAVLSVPQSDAERGLFIFQVKNTKGKKIGSLTLQPADSSCLSLLTTFFTLPGGGFGYLDHLCMSSTLKIGYLYTR